MLSRAEARGLQASAVVMDTWYSSLKNLNVIRDHRWIWVTTLRKNRKVNRDISLETLLIFYTATALANDCSVNSLSICTYICNNKTIEKIERMNKVFNFHDKRSHEGTCWLCCKYAFGYPYKNKWCAMSIEDLKIINHVKLLVTIKQQQ